ncbi:MAG: ATP-binding protein [Myxococcota bacterium]
MDAAAIHDIFGRDAELASLRAELTGAMQGSGRLVLISGEAGIGKTALLSAHAREAQARGALVAWGRCHEMPGAPAYWPWSRLIEELASSNGVPDRNRDDLATVLGDLRAAAATSGEDAVVQRDRFELFGRIASCLSVLAKKSGLLLALDDIHWADTASIELLRFLATELSRDSILLVATLRTHEPSAESTLAGLARPAQSFPLGPLDPAAVDALLAQRLPPTGVAGSTSDGPSDPSDEIARRSGGNPFFALELARLLRAQNGAEAPAAAQALPQTIHRVIGQRLTGLRPEVLDLLRAASVIGRDFAVPLLASAAGRPAPEVHEALLAVVDYGLLARDARPDRFVFVHGLVREVLYESMDEAEAAAIHGHIARALRKQLESDSPDPSSGTLLPSLAHHFHCALRGAPDAGGGARRAAAEYAWRAGVQMLDQLAYEEAALHLERALALTNEASEPTRHVEVSIRLGQALLGQGDRDHAESILERALSRARAGEDPFLFGEAVLAWSLAREEIGAADIQTNERLDTALRALPASDSRLRARLMARLCNGLHLVRGEEERRDELSREAMAMARRLGDPATLVFAQIRHFALLAGPDALTERLASIEQMLEDRSGPTGELFALSVKMDACVEAGDRPGLDAALVAFDEKSREARHPYFRWLGTSHHGALALMEGRYEDAEELVVEALRLGSRVQPETPGLHFAQQMFMLRAWQGRMHEVAPLVEGSADAVKTVAAWRCALADLYDHLGRRVDSQREFEALAHDDFAGFRRDTTWLTSIMLLASLCGRIGDRARAETLYGQLVPYSGRVAVASPMIVAIAPVDMRLGQLATLLGRYDDAERHLTDARSLSRAMRATTWEAEACYHQGRLHLARGAVGDAARASECFEQAEAPASAIGMKLLLDWIEDARAEAPQPAASAGPPARFARDGDGFVLAFEGRSTRLRSMVGLGYIQALLSQPDRELHVLELANPDPEATADSGDAGPHLDAQARAAYTERGRELRAELADAEGCNDAGRRERASEELEFVTAELERALGLGGRERRSGAAAERARVSVTRAIRYATRRIGEFDPALADHLDRHIKTGAFCVYAPPERDRVEWSL